MDTKRMNVFNEVWHKYPIQVVLSFLDYNELLTIQLLCMRAYGTLVPRVMQLEKMYPRLRFYIHHLLRAIALAPLDPSPAKGLMEMLIGAYQLRPRARGVGSWHGVSA